MKYLNIITFICYNFESKYFNQWNYLSNLKNKLKKYGGYEFIYFLNLELSINISEIKGKKRVNFRWNIYMLSFLLFSYLLD